MAKAKKLPSGSWRCQVYSHTETIILPDGSRKQKRIYKSFTCDDPSAAGRRKCEADAALWANGKKEPSSVCQKTLAECMDQYIKERSSVLSPTTIREYKSIRRNYLQGIMDMRLDKITQEDIQQAINAEALTHSPKTVRNIHGILSAVMAAYRPDFVLRTVLPKKVRPDIYVPSDDEIGRIMDAVKGTDLEIPVMLAAFGPMRRGEICALDSVHVNGNIVHVEYSMATTEDNQWIIKSAKSYAGDRYIEFPDFVIQRMDGISGRIVNLNPGQVSNKFRRMLKKAGLPHFRFHDLRHYSASIQHALGIPDAYIMQRGGWGNDGVLKSVYRHVMEQKEKEMSAIANEHFAEICNTKCNTKKEKAPEQGAHSMEIAGLEPV